METGLSPPYIHTHTPVKFEAMTEKRIEEEKQKDGEVRSVRRVQQTRISLSHPDQDKEIIGGMIRLSHTHTHTHT